MTTLRGALRRMISLAFATALLGGGASAALAPAAAAPAERETTTYVDCSASRSGDGTKQAPLNNLDHLAGHFGPGRQVLLKRGTTCEGTVIIDDSGTASKPTVLGAYGEGAAPVLDGQGSPTHRRSAVEVDNQSHIIVQDLTVRGGWFSNVSVESHDGYAMQGITVQRLTVEENAWQGGPNDVTDNFWVMGVGGVVVMPCTASSTISDVLIDRVEASQQHYAGVQVGYHQLYPYSDFEAGIARDGYSVPTCFDEESPRYPYVSPKTGIQGAVISNSQLHDNDAMGAGIFGATDVLLRGNDLYRNGSGVGNPKNTMNGTGAWWDTTENVTAEWNNAWGNRVGWTGNDGTGLDADRNTENSIIQNNYLHDNGGYGASVIAAYGDASATIRHNLIMNNGTHNPDASPDVMVSTYASRAEDGTTVTGQVDGLWIYGNTILRDEGRGKAAAIRLQSRYRTGTPISIVNNILSRGSGGTIYSFTGASAAEVDVVSHNLVSSDGQFGPAEDIEGTPVFRSTAREGMAWPTGAAFRLHPHSPGIDTATAYDATVLPGAAASTSGMVDLAGARVPDEDGFAVGADTRSVPAG